MTVYLVTFLSSVHAIRSLALGNNNNSSVETLAKKVMDRQHLPQRITAGYNHEKRAPYKHPAFGVPLVQVNYGPPPKELQTGLPFGQQVSANQGLSGDNVSGGHTGRLAHSGFRDVNP